MSKPTLEQLYNTWIPERERRSQRTLRKILESGKPKRDSTHWCDCWEVHRECALAQLNKIECNE